MPGFEETDSLNPSDWEDLLDYIASGECTPFLGAGVNSDLLPLATDLAVQWAREHQYPLPGLYNNRQEVRYRLDEVAQFLSLKGNDRLRPKRLIRTMFREYIRSTISQGQLTKFATSHHPLSVLSQLPLPVYITTNYDDLMFRSLRLSGKNPNIELCGWNDFFLDRMSVRYISTDTVSGNEVRFSRSRFPLPAEEAGYTPTGSEPVIFHLHGHYEVEDSMVLTENDYIDFLVSLSRDPKLLPLPIRNALTRHALLFVGYSLSDINFRVIFRGLLKPFPENRRPSISIQLDPDYGDSFDRNEVRNYIQKYFKDSQITVCWVRAEVFLQQLWEKWEAYSERRKQS